MNKTTNRRPHAIVIGLDSMQGLQTARILAGHDIPVIAVASDPKHHSCRTKVCERILFADTAGEELLEILETLGRELEQKAVLYPCQDKFVALVSRHRRRLEARYHVMLADPDIVDMLMDKIRFYRYAQEAGLPIPSTFFLNSRSDAERAASKLEFPCILKPPLRSPEWDRHTKSKVFKASSADELLTLYDQTRLWSDTLIAQQWVEGNDADLYSCNCYFNADSEPIVTFVARKLRQWPPRVGSSCLGEECRNDVVLNETVRLFVGVRYRGLGYVEMKRDARSGKHFIIEPNIGRPTGRSAIAEAGGVELLYTMYCEAVGLPYPKNLEQKYEGVKWIDLRHDFQSAMHYWRNGELSLREWWRSWRGRKAYALFSWSDPAPFLWDLQRAFCLLLIPKERAKRSHTRLLSKSK